jgi:hypothetical protein
LLEGWREALVAQHCRADAAGEGAQLVERVLELDLGVGQQVPDGGRGVSQAPVEELAEKAQRDEALLGAVVQVALQPPALAVSDGHQPGPGLGHLRELGVDLRWRNAWSAK